MLLFNFNIGLIGAFDLTAKKKKRYFIKTMERILEIKNHIETHIQMESKKSNYCP